MWRWKRVRPKGLACVCLLGGGGLEGNVCAILGRTASSVGRPEIPRRTGAYAAAEGGEKESVRWAGDRQATA